MGLAGALAPDGELLFRGHASPRVGKIDIEAGAPSGKLGGRRAGRRHESDEGIGRDFHDAARIGGGK
jgi:hypothetical protein